MSRPPGGDDPTATPDLDTAPASHDSMPVLPELPGYVPGETIGRGGMGEVIAARDVTLDREVALKRMKMQSPTSDAIARFMREAKIQARLDHPSIVPVHEMGTDVNGNPYFTMKRLSGRTLAQVLESRTLSLQALLRAFVDVCFAVERAHAADVVHRDLKPSNVMLGDFNDVYVIDWGVARVMRTKRTSSMAAAVDIDSLPVDETGVGVMLGTPGFMAPEQMKGDDVSPAADVYSLGALLFEMLAGEPLHPPGKQAISHTLASPTESPAKRKPERAVPPELDELCVAALDEDPAKRPTARELGDRVQRYLDGDRDLERRRTLAAEQLAKARKLVTEPARRTEGGQMAARALALDPESKEAAELVSRLILEPPKELPPALVESLEDSERKLNAQRGRSAMIAFLTLWLVLPVFIIFQHIKDWTQLALLYAVVTLMAILSWENGRTGRTPTWMTAFGNFAVAVMFSRLTGSFVLTVGLVAGQTLALSSRPWFVHNRKWMIAWIVVSLLTPFTLEWFGLIESTWHMAPGGLYVTGTILDTTHTRDVVVLAFSQCALAVVVGLFGMSITRAREEAQRRAHIQAWHLQQLLPGANKDITGSGSADKLASTR
ncbi:MAG TPA: serine/threonine-protein kinase [Kofleriaceae bacterium]|nr:serine/threonine-protein kinase [Kofleriaceae bacterium]